MQDTDRLSWLRVPTEDELPPEVIELWQPSLEKLGFVPNVLRLYALRPEHLLAWNERQGELTLTPGQGIVEFRIPEVGLQPGAYTIGATVRRRPAPDTIDWFFGNAVLYVQPGKSVRGYFYSPHEWRLIAAAAARHECRR